MTIGGTALPLQVPVHTAFAQIWETNGPVNISLQKDHPLSLVEKKMPSFKAQTSNLYFVDIVSLLSLSLTPLDWHLLHQIKLVLRKHHK